MLALREARGLTLSYRNHTGYFMPMDTPETRGARRRSNADYRWTSAKAFAFLQALAETGSVAQAARGVGMSRQSAYRLRARMGERFAAVWDEGLALARMFREGAR